MPPLRTLDDPIRKEFETPPLLNPSRRRIFFSISSWANNRGTSKSTKNSLLKRNI